MDGFTILDLGVLLIIAVSALLAYSRGVVRETTAIIGWVVATLLAFMFADATRPLVRQIPYLGDILGDSCELLILASFAINFSIALLVFSIFTPLFSSIVQKSILAGIDRTLGLLFGVCRGIVLVVVAYFIYFTVMPNQQVNAIETSRSALIFKYYADDFRNQSPENLMNWVREQYDELINECNE